MTGRRTGVIDNYLLGKVMKLNAARLGERCGTAAIDLLSSRLTEALGPTEEDMHFCIRRRAIEEHEQNVRDESYRAVLVDAVRDAALAFAQEDPTNARETVRKLLKSPYPTLTRIGIYICGERYPDVGSVFWEEFKEEWFTAFAYWHEVFWFIKKAFPRFSAPHRAQFLQVVHTARIDWKDAIRASELDEVHRRNLLHPATGLGDGEIDAEFNALVEKHGPTREHADVHVYSKAVWIGDRSPVAPDELLTDPPEALAQRMEAFEPHGGVWDGPTRLGFAASISAAVRASNDGFQDRLSLFYEVRRPYQHGLLRGLKERWTDDKRDVPWQDALELMKHITQSSAFAQEVVAEEVKGGWEPNVDWVVSDIADLIKAGIDDDSRSMPDRCMSLAVEVLESVLDALPPSGPDESNDAVSHAINSPRGRSLKALIELALAMRRLEVASGQALGNAWTLTRPRFERELQLSARGENGEFATFGGLYCANFHYLCAQWVEENFERLFPRDSPAAWNCAAQGFAYQGHPSEWLYTRLRSGGHLELMIRASDLPDSVAQRALEFVGLAHLNDLEALTPGGDGLLDRLVAELHVESLSHLCWFFWTLRGDNGLSDEKRQKILRFWVAVAQSMRSSEKVVPELHKKLSLLAVHVRTVLEASVEAAWVDAAPYAQGHVLVEQLARLAEYQPGAVGRVFLAALKGFLPEYEAEDVVRCVKGLAAAGHVEVAEQICVEYAKRDSNLLKNAYADIRRPSGERSGSC